MDCGVPGTPEAGQQSGSNAAAAASSSPKASPLRLVVGPPRCIAHVDLDCFYCQVEVRRRPELKGKPVAVVQYNPWESGGVATRAADDDREDNRSNGSLIAVSYEARAQGVKRNMRGAQARAACPSLTLVQVPTAHGKSDMKLYRDAGSEVAEALGGFAAALEKASVDEAYVDVTEAATRLLAARSFKEVLEEARGTHVAGCDSAAGAPKARRRELREGLPVTFEDNAQHQEPKQATSGAGAPGCDSHADPLPPLSQTTNSSSSNRSPQDDPGHRRTVAGGAAPSCCLPSSSDAAAAAATVGVGAPQDPTPTLEGKQEGEENEEGEKGEEEVGWFDRPESEWSERERLLAAGCAVVARARAEVLARTGFTCSAGVADNKLMAKLCSGLHKPNQQTALPRAAVPRLMDGLPLDRIRGLGGKLGARVAAELAGGSSSSSASEQGGGSLSAAVMCVGELSRAPAARLRMLFGDKTGQWLHRMAHGLDDEPVKDRRHSDSVQNGKCYNSRQTLTSLEKAASALREISGEISSRLEAERSERRREPRTLTLSVLAEKDRSSSARSSSSSSSCSCPYRTGLTGAALADEAVRLLRSWAGARAEGASVAGAAGISSPQPLRIHGLFLTASNFHPLRGNGCQSLSKFLVAAPSSPSAAPTDAAAASLATAAQPHQGPPGHQATPNGRAPQLSASSQHGALAGAAAKGSGCPWSPASRDSLPEMSGRLRREDIDEAVLQELPEDIRREVLMASSSANSGFRRPLPVSSSGGRGGGSRKKLRRGGSSSSSSRGGGGSGGQDSRSIKSFFGRAEGGCSGV